MGLRNRSCFKDDNCFFVTTTCHGFKHLFRDERYYKILYDSLQFVTKKYKTDILAYVFMPNHIHLILYFKESNHLSDLMRDFKKFTSGEIRRLLQSDGKRGIVQSIVYQRREQLYKVWMDRFDDVMIESDHVIETKIDYIHHNPVKAGLVKYPEDFPYSSAKAYQSEHIDPLVVDYREYFEDF